MTALKPARMGVTVVTSLVHAILTVSLDRPDAAHARNQVMRDELASLRAAVAEDRGIRAMIVAGTGNRFFCAGMDLKVAGKDEAAITRRDRMRRSRDIEQLATLPQPTIAAINGYALGGGLETALACDMRVAASGTQMGLPKISQGLVPGGGSTQRLPRHVVYGRAFELVVSGRTVTADEAYARGIVDRVRAPDELLPAALELACRYAKNAEPAVRYAKVLLRASLDVPLNVGVDSELDSLLTLVAGASDSTST